MIDIIGADENGLHTFNTQTSRAKNILSVQLGSLEYAKDLGIDLRYFLTETVKFQNESFKAYLVEILANWGINVATLSESIQTLYSSLVFDLLPEDDNTGLIAR